MILSFLYFNGAGLLPILFLSLWVYFVCSVNLASFQCYMFCSIWFFYCFSLGYPLRVIVVCVDMLCWVGGLLFLNIVLLQVFFVCVCIRVVFLFVCTFPFVLFFSSIFPCLFLCWNVVLITQTQDNTHYSWIWLWSSFRDKIL